MNFALTHRAEYTPQEAHWQYVEHFAEAMGKQSIEFPLPIDNDFEDYLVAHDVDMLFISCVNSRREIQYYLNYCRELRIPYLFLLDTTIGLTLPHTILLPVTLLEEEVHKAQFCAHIARFCKAEVLILRAHDYGHKALQNAQKIITFLEKFEVAFSESTAVKDSFSMWRELPQVQRERECNLTILTASREYGLDDIIFGPPERAVISRSTAPVMLVNPRGDLYSLCD